MLDTWVNEYGTPELKRAHAEGYEVKKGVATILTNTLACATGMKKFEQADWLDVGERTSPRAEAFAARDCTRDAIEALDLPDGWSIDVSRISRFALPDGTYFTGVTLDVRDEHSKHLARYALNFES